MAASLLAIKMKLRTYSAEKLQAIIEDTASTEVEVTVAKEYLAKLVKVPDSLKEKIQKSTPSKKTVQTEESVESPNMDIDTKMEPVLAEEQNIQLTKAEKERLAEAEKMYNERSAAHKAKKKEKASIISPTSGRTTKRENLQESKEVPGLKVGSKVAINGLEGVTGVITRLYISSDGKEKVMVSVDDNKPMKKRVSACSLI